MFTHDFNCCHKLLMLWKETQKDFQTNIYSQFAISGFAVLQFTLLINMSALWPSKEICRKIGNLHENIKLLAQLFDFRFPNRDVTYLILLPQVCVMEINAQPKFFRQMFHMGSDPKLLKSKHTRLQTVFNGF